MSFLIALIAVFISPLAVTISLLTGWGVRRDDEHKDKRERRPRRRWWP